MRYISGRPLDQKEWDAKQKAAEKRLRKKLHKKKGEVVFVELVYTCRKCELEFYYDEPCADTEDLRQETTKQFCALQQKMDKDFEAAEQGDYEKDPYNLWSVVERLQYVYHTRKRKE